MWLTRHVPVNLSEYLRTAAAESPDDVALIEPRTGRSSTWQELETWVDRVAQALLGQDLVAGHRVMLVLGNGIDLAVAYLAVLRGGLIAVPLSPESTAREIGQVVVDCQPKLIVADGQTAERVRRADIGDALIVVHRTEPGPGELSVDDLLARRSAQSPTSPPDAESPAVVVYTSGVSGSARGVQLSHRALAANIEQVASIEPAVLRADDVVLGLLPMFHVYGLNAVLGQALRARSTVVLLDGFDPDETLRIIADHGVTVLPIAPPVIAAWAGRAGVAAALSGVRLILSGSAPLDPDLAIRFERGTGHRVEQGYGLTEASPVVTTTLARPADPVVRESVGWPIPGVEVELRDSLGQPAAPGDPAQIWIRGENLFSGYWPDGAAGPGADGWHPTGDVGIVESDGSIALVDRLTELVMVSGFNVYPTEVEEVIAHVPGVARVAVVGIPDERTGETVVAFVVPGDGADSDQVRDAVQAACVDALARFKVPSRIAMVSGLPHSPTGKIAKARLRAMARGEESHE